MEYKILSAACRRTNYDRITAHVNPEKDFSPAGILVWKEIANYYRLDPDAIVVDPDILSSRLCRPIPSEHHKKLLQDFVAHLDPDVSGVNVLSEWVELRRQRSREELLRILSLPVTPRADITAALQDYQAWMDATVPEEAAEAPYTVHAGLSLSDLQSHTGSGNKLPILPVDLNTQIGGGALPGHTLFFFARPEVGKTSFALNLARGIANPGRHPPGRKVLYLGNEDPMAESLIPRAWSCFSGMPWKDAGPEMESAAKAAGIDNVTFVSLWPGTPAQVEELVKKYSPDVVIVDQVGNLYVKDDSYTQQLGKIMRALRAIAKRHRVVMAAFHQAGDSAQDKLILELGDVSWSNTDMAAQADLMVGIGTNPDYQSRGLRMLSVCKNKLSGWHGHFLVELDETTSRLKSMGLEGST